MRLFSQFRGLGQIALRRRDERYDVPPWSGFPYEWFPPLPGKHNRDPEDGSFREPLLRQWGPSAEATRRCDKVRRTKSPCSRLYSIRNALREPLVELPQAWLCFPVRRLIGPGVLPLHVSGR